MAASKKHSAKKYRYRRGTVTAAVSSGKTKASPKAQLQSLIRTQVEQVLVGMVLPIAAAESTRTPLANPPVTAARPLLAAASLALSPINAGKRSSFSVDTLTTDKRSIASSMDPRLQMTVARARMGAPRVATASAGPDETPVIAKVTDLDAWVGLSEVREGTVIGEDVNANVIVTARLPVSRLEHVRSQPFVISLKAPRPIHPALASTIEETEAKEDLLPASAKPKGGQGVIVGIVDFGCDFAHRNLRRKDGSTRVEVLWDQAAQGTGSGMFGYGRVIRAKEINAALATDNPYGTLGYAPESDSLNQRGTHGTHVTDIAAGNGLGSGAPGCAPETDIIFVDLSASDVPWSGQDAVGKNFGDSVQLLEAVKFVFDEAGDRPCVVNLSLGTNGGPHDGTSLVEQGLDTLVRAKPNRSVVIAASNSYEDGIHASGQIPPDGKSELHWDVVHDNVPAEMEIWLPGNSHVGVELVAPDGTSVAVVEPGSNAALRDGNNVVVFIANRLDEPSNHDNTIGIYLAGVFPAGLWKVRLLPRDANGAPFHAWIERLDGAQSSFAPPRDNSHTLGSISCGLETIVVGSYDAHKTKRPISFFSSAGPTRDGRNKPEVSAPGHAVLAAWSRTGNRVVSKSGTSMAAPAVTGIIALLYAEAARQGKSLTTAQLRTLLTHSAKKAPPDGAGWDGRYGSGRINAAALLTHFG